jgi:hypothetical protein
MDLHSIFNPLTMPLRYLVLVLISIASLNTMKAQATRTEIKQVNGQWQLFRNGKPYYVKGAGGHVQLEKLVSMGGNSIRTWSTDNAKEILDAAQAKGLTVMMGLWVQHERHGFDYNDKEKVALQLEAFTRTVRELKDHPALLLWGVGNEVDLFYSNTAVWDAVNDIAAMIHREDANHPTCTVTAGLDKEEVRLIKEKAPHIDIYGINTYGDLKQVKQGIRDAGWNGPYLITEWGPNGHWEVLKTKWNASVEQSSSEKADSYAERYTNYIAADTEKCMGSYVFLWGQKQETTSTWYGLFSEKGESCEALDRLEKIWTGKFPENRAPRIDSMRLNGMTKGQHILLYAGEKFTASVLAADPDNDKLKFSWQIIPESSDIRSGGDAEAAPQPIQGLMVRNKGKAAVLRSPEAEGAYRLYLTIRDGNNHYAYGNVPFYVHPRDPNASPVRAVSFKKQQLQR